MNKFIYCRKYRGIDFELWNLGIEKTGNWIGDFIIFDTKRKASKEDYYWLSTFNKDDSTGNLVKVILYVNREINEQEEENFDIILHRLLQFYEGDWVYQKKIILNYNEIAFKILKDDIEKYTFSKPKENELKKIIKSYNTNFFGGWLPQGV